MITPIKQKHTVYEGVTWKVVYEVRLPNNADGTLGNIVPLTGCTGRLVAKRLSSDVAKVIDVSGVFAPDAGQVEFSIPATTTVGGTWKVITFDAKLYWPDGVTVDILAFGTMTLDQTNTPPTDPA